MNRLILIGNGFDRAHNLETEYSNFILWYLQKSWDIAINKKLPNTSGFYPVYEDKLISVQLDSIADIELFKSIESKSIKDFKNLKNGIKNENNKVIARINFKSQFVEKLIEKLHNAGWADIENDYFSYLLKLIKSENVSLLKNLNIQFDILKSELEIYLNDIEKKMKKNKKLIPSLKSLIYGPSLNYIKNAVFEAKLENVMMLNFNYTSTPEKYKKENAKIIYIHGKLKDADNPIIFGYGDEVSENYKLIENENENELFKHIKSFDYFKTDNYSRLLAFLENPFEVYVMGHSCGLSDRTLLSTIFQNENCKIIKIFYHKSMENYRTITYNISRHFNDKSVMRKKVLNFKLCEEMPQLTT